MQYRPVEMWWHTVTHGRGSEGETGEWSGYSSHYLGTWCIQHYYRWCAHLGCASSRLNWRPPADLNGLVRFARKTKSGFCVCAITFQLASTAIQLYLLAEVKVTCSLYINGMSAKQHLLKQSEYNTDISTVQGCWYVLSPDQEGNKLMFLSEWREFPSAPCLAGKRNLMTARVSMLLKSRASLNMLPSLFPSWSD